MSIAKPSWMLLVVGGLTLVACEQKIEPRQRNALDAGAKGKAKGQSVSFSVPDDDVFELAEGDASKLLSSFWYTLEAKDEDCDSKTRKETRDYAGSETVTIETIANCDYELTVSIGKSKKAYYKTESAIDVSTGDDEATFRLKRTDAGEAAGFKAAWVDSDGDSGGNSDKDDKDDKDDGDGGDAKVTYADIKSKLEANCTSCHAPGRSRSSSDLSTYAGAKQYGSDLVSRISGGTMPPSGKLPSADVALFEKWKTGGYLEKATATTDQGGGGTNDDKIVEFRIPKGTGNGAWNTAATPATLKVGQTLRIYNDDTVVHQMHTNGAPCPHGNIIQPGAYGDCVATRSYTGTPLYDHNTRGDFHIRVDQ